MTRSICKRILATLALIYLISTVVLHRLAQQQVHTTTLTASRTRIYGQRSYCLLPVPREPHPFQGARDEHGCWGYIHDANYIHRNPFKFTNHPPLSHNEGICDKRIGKGPEGRQGALALKKIRIEAPTYVKVLCIVYTHSNRHHVLQSIVETWGSRCSGFLAASNKTDKKVGAVDLPHLGNESYQSMYQKVRSIWAYVHRHYLMKYDFFFIGGDDVFVIAENLKHSLKDYDPDKTPLYLGGAMTRHPLIRKRYCGGGSGYVLNRACLRVLVEQMFDKPECRPLEIRSDEDVIISDCLRPIVNCTHSVDEHDETRFHPLSAQFHASWAYPTSANWFPQLLLKHSNITATMKPMLESVSETSVSFHLVLESQFAQLTAPATNFSDKGMRRYHALLFNLCENLSLSNWTPRVRRKQRADPH